MNLSVIIPCYNEVSSIEQVVQSVIDIIGDEGEIIIVDDFSTDGTRELLKDNVDGKLARVIYQDKNQGKGAALRTGFANATKDIVIVQDADFEYDPRDYPVMIEPFLTIRQTSSMAPVSKETDHTACFISGIAWVTGC